MRRLVTLFLGVFALSFFSALAAEHSPLTIYTKDGEQRLELELAVTPEQRMVGLQNRTSLPPGGGMLFVFPQPTTAGFWMKDTLIALDIIFIDENYSIIHIEHNALPHTLQHRTPGKPYFSVVELRGGAAKKRGIAKGDRVRFHLPQHIKVR